MRPACRIVGDLVEQFLADRAVDHLLHMRGVAEQERQVEDVEIVDHRPERADADARELRWRRPAPARSPPSRRRAASTGYICTLSRPLVAASSFLPMFSTATDRRIAVRVHVGCLQHELLLRQRRTARADESCDALRTTRDHARLHGFLPALPCCQPRPAGCVAERGCMLVIISYDDLTTLSRVKAGQAAPKDPRCCGPLAAPRSLTARSHRAPDRANHERRARAGRAAADRAGDDRGNRGEPHGGARGGRGIARRRPGGHAAGRRRIRRRVRRAGRSASTATSSRRCIDVIEVMELRTGIEVEAAGLAAERASAADLRRIEDAYQAHPSRDRTRRCRRR